MKKNYLNLLPKNKESKILEIGFGNGLFLNFLIKQGYSNFLGIEIGKEQFEYVKSNITENIELIKDTNIFLEKNKETFDVIVFSDVLEHIAKENIIFFLKNVKKSLRNEGTVICKVPNIANPFTIRSRYRDFTHTVGFTKESLEQVFSTVRFRDIKVMPDSFAFNFMGYILQILRNLFGIVIRGLCVLYGGDIVITKNIIIYAKK